MIFLRIHYLSIYLDTFKKRTGFAASGTKAAANAVALLPDPHQRAIICQRHPYLQIGFMPKPPIEVFTAHDVVQL